MTAPMLSEEDVLLTKDAAKTLLETHGATVIRVLRVDVDSILYLGASERPMTAWLARHGARIELRVQSGFPAEPAYGLLPRPDLSTMYPDEQESDPA